MQGGLVCADPHALAMENQGHRRVELKVYRRDCAGMPDAKQDRMNVAPQHHADREIASESAAQSLAHTGSVKQGAMNLT